MSLLRKPIPHYLSDQMAICPDGFGDNQLTLPGWPADDPLMSAVSDPTSKPNRAERTSLAKNLAHYTPSVLFRSVAGIANLLIRPRLLNPEWFGLFSLLNTIPSYCSYLHLGSREYMRFAVPKLQVTEENDEEVRRIEASVFWGTIVPNAAVAIVLLLLAVFGGFETHLTIGLAAMAGLVMLTCLYEHCVNVMKGHQMFRELSRGMYVRNATQLVLSIVLMLAFGFYGLLIALPVALLAGLIYLRTCYPFTKVGRFRFPVYADMVRDGFPLAASAFLMTLMVTNGRLVVAGYLSTEDVGCYALATLALRGMLQFSGAAREVVEPRIMEQADTLRDTQVLDQYLYRPLVINAICVPLVIAPLYFVLPPVIDSFLPKYSPGIPPLQIALFGFYFLALFYPLRGIIVAHRMQAALAGVLLLCLGINVGLSFVALEREAGITGVAVANSISYAALLLLTIGALKLLRGVPIAINKIWPVAIAFPLLCGGVFASETWLEPTLPSGLTAAIIQATVMTVCGLALLTVAAAKLDILGRTTPIGVLKMLRKKPKA